ncbi:hypothetical protein PVS06_004228 [Escherichia coli]|nr:hypothetical protein [Escherichia coli]EJE0548313.1 hypothetical protein [Escherichia coli]EKM8863400.1 hypothetical protein [Escherichia coli]
MVDNNLLSLKKIGVLLIGILINFIACDVIAASSADVEITSYVREPACTVDVPSEIDLGTSYGDSKFGFRTNVTMKIECQESINVTTWLTAVAETLGSDSYIAIIQGTEEKMYLYEGNYSDNKKIALNGLTEFCKGNTDRECTLSVMSEPTKIDYTGDGTAKMIFNLNVQ